MLTAQLHMSLACLPSVHTRLKMKRPAEPPSALDRLMEAGGQTSSGSARPMEPPGAPPAKVARQAPPPDAEPAAGRWQQQSDPAPWRASRQAAGTPAAGQSRPAPATAPTAPATAAPSAALPPSTPPPPAPPTDSSRRPFAPSVAMAELTPEAEAELWQHIDDNVQRARQCLWTLGMLVHDCDAALRTLAERLALPMSSAQEPW